MYLKSSMLSESAGRRSPQTASDDQPAQEQLAPDGDPEQ